MVGEVVKNKITEVRLVWALESEVGEGGEGGGGCDWSD